MDKPVKILGSLTERMNPIPERKRYGFLRNNPDPGSKPMLIMGLDIPDFMSLVRPTMTISKNDESGTFVWEDVIPPEEMVEMYELAFDLKLIEILN